MDIVDKVFEKLNLDYDADKERAHTARVRQKESLARKKARLGVFGGVAAVIFAGVGLAVILPQVGGQTEAESDISVVFREDEQPIQQIFERVNELATENLSEDGQADEENQTDATTVKTEDTEARKASGNQTAKATKRTTRQATNSQQSTAQSATQTETIVHIIDSGEQVDQGTNDCQPVESGSTGVVLWCSGRTGESESAPAATNNNEADQPQESKEQINTEN